jgi:hypothetical protein
MKKKLGIGGAVVALATVITFSLMPYTCSSAKVHIHDRTVTETMVVTARDGCALSALKDTGRGTVEGVTVYFDADPNLDLNGKTVTVQYDQTCGQVAFLKYD